MKTTRILLLLTCIFIFSLIASINQSIPTITYFPPDDTISFTNQKNELLYDQEKLSWHSMSTTNKPTYLRQDIALIYMNGVFKGFSNMWKSNTKTLEFHKDFSNIQSGLYESISYHYSEAHIDDNIRSAASMGYSQIKLDCINNDCTVLPSKNGININDCFHTNDSVQRHWDELLSYFTINESVFKKIKLSQLYIYNERPLPSLTQRETDDVINHLWEGLYANYIIELMETKEQKRAHYMPLVLYKEDEIRVLYEINGKKEQLIQKIDQ